MNKDEKEGKFADDLGECLSMLARECLLKRPEDVETFCLEYLAKKCGMQLSPIVRLTRGLSMAAEEDLIDLVQDVGQATLKSSVVPKELEPIKPVYESSEEGDEEVRTVLSSHSSLSRFDAADDYSEGEMVDTRLVKTAAFPDGLGGRQGEEEHGSGCYLFSRTGIPEEELTRQINKYKKDARMKSLFCAWDGDDSGAVDFVELVLALHKFEKVSNAGIDIQVASDALVQFVESDTERELNLKEFTHVIIVFCRNTFHKDFDEVADHLLAVATSSSEAAVLKAISGVDISDLEAADREEEDFLRETAKGMEEHVNDNIMRLRTRRVAFSARQLS